MPGIIHLVKPPRILVLDLQEPLTFRNQLMVGSYYINIWVMNRMVGTWYNLTGESCDRS